MLGVIGFLGFGSAQALTPPPPELSTLVFSNGGRLVSVKSDGTERTVLTRRGKVSDGGIFDSPGDQQPKVSPDGKKILFFRVTEQFASSSSINAEGKLMVANIDGTGAREILKPTKRVTWREASWMPDGSIVAAKRVRKGKKRNFRRESSVVTMKLDGSSRRTIFKLKPHVMGSMKKDLATNFQPTGIASSPDGQDLLVTIQNGYRDYDRRLVRVSVDTGRMKLVAKKSYSGNWSPDGEKIVFVSDRRVTSRVCNFGSLCRIAGDLYLADADGGNQARLTKTAADESGPSWSADGGAIAFSSTRNNPGKSIANEIYSMTPDGSCLSWVTNGSPASTSPSWIPGGTSIYDCAVTGLEPLVEGKPAKKTSMPMKPRLWFGPEINGALYTSEFEIFGIAAVMYEDCGTYFARQCAPPTYLMNISNCLFAGSFAQLYDSIPKRTKFVKRRGVTVLQDKEEGTAATLVLAGGSFTIFGADDIFGLGDGEAMNLKQQLRLVDQLRPVGTGSATGKLPPLMIPRQDIRKSRKVTRTVKRSGSVRLAAERLKMSPKEIRSNLGLKKKARRFGGLRPMKCPGLDSFFDLEIDDSSSSGGDSGGRALRALGDLKAKFG